MPLWCILFYTNMGIQTNIVSKNGNPPISYNILQGESNEFPRNIILDANYVNDVDVKLQEQIDAIKEKGGIVAVVANKAALDEFDTSTLTNNDVVEVLADDTHDGNKTYYKWNFSTSEFEYIGEEISSYSKEEIDTKVNDINGRIDQITATAVVGEETISFNIP